MNWRFRLGERKIFNRMSQKGFSNIAILFLVIILLSLGTGAYFIINKNIAKNTQPSSNSVKTSMKLRDETREKYAEAQKKYQNGLYTLFISKWPDLKPIIEINRDLQVALVDSRTVKFYYLLEHSPNKIIRDKGVSAFANFDWSEVNTQALRTANSTFASLENRIKQLRTSNDGHPMWSELRKRFQGIANDNEYLSITNALNQAISEVEQLLRNGN